MGKYNKVIYKILSIVILINILSFKVYGRERSEVHIINTEQSDCILIKGEKLRILIDTGAESTSKRVVAYLKNQKIKRLDYIILTHFHDDHYGGLNKIIKEINVDKVYIPYHPNPLRDILYNYLYLSKVKVSYIREDFKIKENGINLSALLSEKYDGENENNNSIVLAGEIHGDKYLFSSDVEVEREKEIIAGYKSYIENSDYFKVPHHGLNTSSHEEFLNVVMPKMSIITCNGSESPDNEVIKRLNNVSTRILRTDMDGNIIIRSSSR